MNAGNGLVIIQLKELPPTEPILDFDSESFASSLHQSSSQPQLLDPLSSHAVSEDARFEAAYKEALKSSGRPFPFTQLCLVGEGRAGKTALANSLCGRSFVQTASTIGVGLERMQVSHVDLQVSAAGCWDVLPQSAALTQKFSENQLAWAMSEQLQGKQRSSSGTITDIIRVSEPNTIFGHGNTPLVPSLHSGHPVSASIASAPAVTASASTSLVPPLLSALPQPNASSAMTGAAVSPLARARSSASLGSRPSPAVRMDKQMVLGCLDEEEPLRINLMDLGGQKAFYSLHSLYLTRYSVYIVVFNMQWLIGQTADEVADGISKRASCISYLSFWLNSIYLCRIRIRTRVIGTTKR